MNETDKLSSISYSVNYNYRQINKYQKIVISNFEKSNEKDKIVESAQLLQVYVTEYFKVFDTIEKAQFLELNVLPALSKLLELLNISNEYINIEKLVFSEKATYLFNREYVYRRIFKDILLYGLKQKLENPKT